MTKNKKFWEFKNKTEDNGELMLYGDISESTWDGDEVTPKSFKEELDNLGEIKNLNIYINSRGGDIFAGQSIYTMLQRHTANKTVYIDGLAGSIASVIAMAGNKIKIPKGAMIAIHNGMVGLLGMYNAIKLREVADRIEKITQSVVLPAYERSGQTKEKIQEMLDAETWMSAQEAVDLGFADEIEEGLKVAASISGDDLTINGVKFSIKEFNNLPESLISEAETKPQEEEKPEPKADETPIPNENGDESQPISDNITAQNQQFYELRKKINQI
jgi:ATP-dependent Clp protease protease subunit